MSLKLQKFLSRSCFKHLLRTKRQIWPSHNTAHNFKTNSRTQTDIYPQRLVGPTRSDFTPIFGEASIVDRPLARMHDQQRQTVLIIFVPKKSKHAFNQNQSVFNLIYYMKVTVWGSERCIHPVQIELPSAGPLLRLHQGLSVNLWTHGLRQSQLHYVRKRPLLQMMPV